MQNQNNNQQQQQHQNIQTCSCSICSQQQAISNQLHHPAQIQAVQAPYVYGNGGMSGIVTSVGGIQWPPNKEAILANFLTLSPADRELIIQHIKASELYQTLYNINASYAPVSLYPYQVSASDLEKAHIDKEFEDKVLKDENEQQ